VGQAGAYNVKMVLFDRPFVLPSLLLLAARYATLVTVRSGATVGAIRSGARLNHDNDLADILTFILQALGYAASTRNRQELITTTSTMNWSCRCGPV